MRKVYPLLLSGFFLSLLFTPLWAAVIERVIVAIDGDPYTVSDLRQYARDKINRVFPAGDLDQVGDQDKDTLEQFITDKILGMEVKRLRIKISEGDIDDYIQRIREKNQITDQEFKAALDQGGMTLPKYREAVRLEIEKNEIVDAQVHKKVNVTQEDMERYYRANSRKYTTQDRVHLRHILISVPEKSPPEQEKAALQRAQEILSRARAGEDFGALARTTSEGAGASSGGDIGWLQRGQLMKEIEETAFQLTPGQVSSPIRSSLGFHLVKLEEQEAGQIPPLPVVQGKIREELYAKALEERFQKWLKTDLRKSHRVDVKLAGVFFRPEESQEGTVSALIAAESKKNRQKPAGFWDYVNPLNYVVRATPVEGEDAEGELSGKKIVSVFGVPLFSTASADEPEELPVPAESKAGSAGNTEKSGGFFSSIWKAITP